MKRREVASAAGRKFPHQRIVLLTMKGNSERAAELGNLRTDKLAFRAVDPNFVPFHISRTFYTVNARQTSAILPFGLFKLWHSTLIG